MEPKGPRRATPIALTLLGIGGLFVLGVRRGWFHRGFSVSETAVLEQRWEHLVELSRERPAALPEPTPGTLEDSRLLGERLAAVTHGDSDPTTLADVLAILARNPTAEVPSDVRDSRPALALDQVVQDGLGGPDSSADDLARLTTLVRRAQSRTSLIGFLAGQQSLRRVLDRAEHDPLLARALAGVPAPEADELFLALCRETVASDEDVRTALSPGSSAGLDPGDLTFTRLAHRAALLDRVLPLETQRHDPAAWTTLDPPATSTLERWWSLATQDPSGVQEVMAALDTQGLGTEWAALVERWRRVVGSTTGGGR